MAAHCGGEPGTAPDGGPLGPRSPPEELSPLIVVTGATGTLGSAVVESLLQRAPASEVGVSVRDASKAQHLSERGVRVREASFTDRASCEKAFEGADRVLIISTDRMGDSGTSASLTAVEAAVAAGARRIFYTSHMGASHDSAFQACRDHAVVEDALATCGTPWTSLRNGFYAASALRFAEPCIPAGDVAVPADGPVSWTTHRDLADAAAVLLTDEGVQNGPTPALTAATTSTFADIARVAAEVTGHPVSRTVVDDSAFLAQMTGYGTPQVVAEQLLGIFVAARNGEFARTGPELGRLIGRPAQGIDETVREALAA